MVRTDALICIKGSGERENFNLILAEVSVKDLEKLVITLGIAFNRYKLNPKSTRTRLHG